MRSTTLARAHDLDIVAGLEGRLRPGGARDDSAVERDRDAALRDVDRLLFQQGRQRRRDQRFVRAVDPDVGVAHVTFHLSPFYSAALAGVNRSMPNGRMAGSMVPSSTR